MRKLVLTMSLLALSPLAAAGPQCTEADRSQWQDEQAFQKTLVDQGYKIKVFKVTEGQCYEIYGWNAQGQKVEIYFDPVSGKPVKTEIKD